MFCPNCGKNIKNDVQHCPYCGISVKARKSVIDNNRKPPKQKKVNTSIKSPIISIVISFLIFASSVFGLVWQIMPHAQANVSTPVPTVTNSEKTEYDIDNIQKPDFTSQAFNIVAATDQQEEALNNEITPVANAINAATSAVAQTNPVIDTTTISYYIDSVRNAVQELYNNDEIANYTANALNIVIELNSGIKYIYAPQVNEIDAGASGEAPSLQIATYQPCLSGYDSSLSQELQYIDNGAALIDKTFEFYHFFKNDTDADADFNNGEVDLNICTGFSQFNVLLWHGHGGYNYETGSFMVTGVQATRENNKKYYQLIRDDDILISSSGYYMITASFIEKYVPDNSLENTVVYLGACSSGVDDTLANAFLGKGAKAVFANTATISTRYNLEMIYAVSDGLCQQYEDGGFFSVSDALKYAKSQKGEYDPYYYERAQVHLYTENPNFALDWYENYTISERDVVLVLDTSGSMSGTPLEETKKAALEFVNTAAKTNTSVSIVNYDNDAKIQTGFTQYKRTLTNVIDNLYASGGTNIDEALVTAHDLLINSGAKKKIIVLMSDGEPNDGRLGDELIAYANEIKSDDIYIYTLGFFEALSYKTNAQSLLDGIASEGCHYEVANADDLVYFFGDIADQINGQRYIYVKIACPVEVKVTYDGETLSSNSKNPKTRTSFGSLTFEEAEQDDKNDNSGYENSDDENAENDVVKILRLKEGVPYDIEINGTGRGKMDYTIGLMDSDGKYSDFREFKNINITRSTKIETTAENAKSTVLKVDEDGDGRYEKTYKAGANEDGELVSKLWIYITIAFIVASLISIAISSTVLSFRIKNRKSFKIANT